MGSNPVAPTKVVRPQTNKIKRYMSVNLAILVGNVGQNPDIKVFDGGTKKATFSLATSEKYKDRNGEVHENTEWHNIVCWRATADVVERFVKKGTQVYIQGKITTRSWEDQNGQKRYTTEIEVANLQLLGGRQDSQNQGQNQGSYGGYQAPTQQPQYATPTPAPAPVASEPNSLDPQDEDLPF